MSIYALSEEEWARLEERFDGLSAKLDDVAALTRANQALIHRLLDAQKPEDFAADRYVPPTLEGIFGDAPKESWM